MLKSYTIIYKYNQKYDIILFIEHRRIHFSNMLNVVVFDSGYGGEFFADWLEEEIPVVKVTRVIDWRNATDILESPKKARIIAATNLAPHIGKADIIVFANHLLTTTSLPYFRRKYKTQKFVGFELAKPDRFIKRKVLVLTTKAVSKTLHYHNFLFRLKTKTKTLCLDSWPALIDDGELSEADVLNTIDNFLENEKFCPEEIILACAQFQDIKPILAKHFGKKVRIYDSYNQTLRQICKALRLRGSLKKLK